MTMTTTSRSHLLRDPTGQMLRSGQRTRLPTRPGFLAQVPVQCLRCLHRPARQPECVEAEDAEEEDGDKPSHEDESARCKPRAADEIKLNRRIAINTEQQRRNEAGNTNTPWNKRGPYWSERQWGTGREDYSESGNAWYYFSPDQARSRAYHGVEDGLAGISDDYQRLCFALPLWNGKDTIINERLFGVQNRTPFVYDAINNYLVHRQSGAVVGRIQKN